MRVNFIIIGAQKAGTTSLAAQLAEHPQICFSRIKEPAYFNETANWESGLESYHQLFDPKPGQLCGEASTMYTFLPEGPDTSRRLHAYNPDLKLIYIMRNPVNRVVSHYAHNIVRGLEQRIPEQAVAEDARYINRSRYGVQIGPYVELFGRESILLLIFEEYVANQTAALWQIADFLEISRDPFLSTDTTPQHKTIGGSYLKNESVAKLTQTEIFRSVRSFVPEEIRHSVRHRFFSNRLDSAPEFSAELSETIWRFVAGDVKTIEELLGRTVSPWHVGPTS